MFTRINRGRTVTLAVFAFVACVVTPLAAGQSGEGSAEPAPTTLTAAPVAWPPEPAPIVPTRLTLTAGRSRVLNTDFDITRISITNPAIANAVVVQPRAILLDGRTPGTISLFVWGTRDETRSYEVSVEQGVTPLQLQIQALFPGETISVNSSDEAIVLSGQVTSNVVSLRVAELAAAMAPKSKVINLLQLPGGSDSQQVLLQVRFAEVSRRAVTELGASFFTGAGGYKNWSGRSTTQQYPAPVFEGPGSGATVDRKLTFSDFLNLFVFNSKYSMGAVVRALEEKGLFQSLAEPNLIAYNGQSASFLAGGEIPIPVVQGLTNAITIQWKEFGIRLHFKPTIAGDTIRLHVAPEVSMLDYGNGIVMSGFRIPSISTRRAETEVELRDGQSFAIAGLLDNTLQDQVDAMPLLSRIPIIGYLFRSKGSRSERTELMVVVTPSLVRPLDASDRPRLPVNPRRFLPPTDAIGEALDGGGGVQDGPGARTSLAAPSTRPSLSVSPSGNRTDRE